MNNARAVAGAAPLRQLLGTDSLELAEQRVTALTADIHASRPLATTTDFSAG